ncbi:PAS domain-containing sensor histidine kinase [Allosphingosinicella flava]|uniref:histidine kinase n=1 Tax=Allosphingosinicella flava TaxID=2771430 RepID=A0A7T2GKT0_9SPHN|nr:PAS domain-containing sensor histidine kinase [Sphingosinicella flava]QPQ55695.1 PAS domain-containing sensor histidine kinase [Sphingosinicella flava]
MTDSRPRWQRRIAVFYRRTRLVPIFEILTLVALVAMLAVTYFVTSGGASDDLLSPPLVASLLVANLVPATALMVLVARRLAKGRAARSPVGGRGRLHVRLVALFSVIATVPTLMVVIFASLLFQSGFQFWFSDKARTILENADNVAQVYSAENKDRIFRDVQAASGDVVGAINQYGLDTVEFGDYLLYQAVVRDLSEMAVVTVSSAGELQLRAFVNLDDRPLERRIPPETLSQLRKGGVRVVNNDVGDRVEAVVRLDPEQEVYLYISRFVNQKAIKQIDEARSAASDYQETLARSRTLQVRFNILLFLISLLIVALTIWIALALADRLVRPVGQLVNAARRVAGGDLSTRVPSDAAGDELGTLGNAFNRMTRRLEEQTRDLVSANSQLESRRALIEAVLSGVTAGVISVDTDRKVRLINSSAEALLKAPVGAAVGQRLSELAPELDAQLDSEHREDIVQLASGGELRTLAVKRVRVEGGHVITFDDITEQLLDQRRAAWSDVARRIAHEIKNPLTPIQLAAERLQRRYGSEVTSDDGTFERLTSTIVRQVSDLRRMVDEFSSFARMPKPVFHAEPVADIARHALFLHEVAHPDIDFAFHAPDPSPILVCDRRQLGQALTNIVKNGVEAIQQKREDGDTSAQSVAMTISEIAGQLHIVVEDSGVGLPTERSTITEPYVTTRVKGTGLGLAIVKKIVEEHYGSIEFEDVDTGGTRVRLVFDMATLAGMNTVHSEEAVNN